MKKLVPVILAGGSGTRLWPLSRPLFPKQFHALVDDYSLFQNTLRRVRPWLADVAPIVVCNQDHYFICAEQMAAIGVENYHILVEPCGRNSAPAITAAALYAKRLYGDDTSLLVLSADHDIPDVETFNATMRQAFSVVSASPSLMTFGIKPTHAETGYGYIQVGDEVADGACQVAAFTEKPTRMVAEQFVTSGEYYWNSGLFLFPVTLLLESLAEHAPAILQAVTDADLHAVDHADYRRLDHEYFSACPDDSIDYALLEKTKHVTVMPLAIEWTDLGGWRAVHDRSLGKDDCGNVLSEQVMAHDTSNCLVMVEPHTDHLVATVGLKDHVVVHTSDATLIAHRDQSQAVKQIANALKSAGDYRARHGSRVYRPWGYYESIAKTDNFQVKRIGVNPGAKLSLQMHNHRAEHWIVVRGCAEVHNGDDTLHLNSNQSTYIPKKVKHRMTNPGSEMLEVIEVQYGDYLGEDDIVRFDDVYGRVPDKQVVEV